MKYNVAYAQLPYPVLTPKRIKNRAWINSISTNLIEFTHKINI